jgi:hypothetical protein
MEEERKRDVDQLVLGQFRKSYLKRYERWKRKDLLLVALQTMPKQVKTEKVIDNLVKLRSEFAKRLDGES